MGLLLENDDILSPSQHLPKPKFLWFLNPYWHPSQEVITIKVGIKTKGRWCFAWKKDGFEVKLKMNGRFGEILNFPKT